MKKIVSINFSKNLSKENIRTYLEGLAGEGFTCKFIDDWQVGDRLLAKIHKNDNKDVRLCFYKKGRRIEVKITYKGYLLQQSFFTIKDQRDSLWLSTNFNQVFSLTIRQVENILSLRKTITKMIEKNIRSILDEYDQNKTDLKKPPRLPTNVDVPLIEIEVFNRRKVLIAKGFKNDKVTNIAKTPERLRKFRSNLKHYARKNGHGGHGPSTPIFKFIEIYGRTGNNDIQTINFNSNTGGPTNNNVIALLIEIVVNVRGDLVYFQTGDGNREYQIHSLNELEDLIRSKLEKIFSLQLNLDL